MIIRKQASIASSIALLAALLTGCGNDSTTSVQDTHSVVSQFLSHTVVFSNASTVSVWGNNDSGQVGNGTTTNQSLPVSIRLTGLTGLAGVVAGGSHTAVFQNASTVKAWGSNASGQLGLDPTVVASSTVPVAVPGIYGVLQLAAGGYHTLARDTGGAVWGWGGNSYGQLGVDTSLTTAGYRYAPQQISGIGLGTVDGIAAGGSHSLAFQNLSTVRAWGNNSSGQLGNGSNINSSVPVKVPGLYGIIMLTAGGSHNLALDSAGRIWSWGLNSYGQLGTGSLVNSSVPVQVAGIVGTVKQIAAGADHSLALTTAGEVWSWGYNVAGQLGNGTTINSSLPVKVLISDVARIVFVGSHHSIVQKTNGEYWGWGYNGQGQLGDGTTTKRISPVRVTGL